MTAQEWIEELERLREAATPGPWINPGRAYVAQQYGAGKVIADCKSNEFGQAVKDAAYIVAACNAVPRLIYMIEYLAGMLCDEDHGDNDFDGKIQDAFEMTEPKE